MGLRYSDLADDADAYVANRPERYTKTRIVFPRRKLHPRGFNLISCSYPKEGLKDT
jgi:hypothetical protein